MRKGTLFKLDNVQRCPRLWSENSILLGKWYLFYNSDTDAVIRVMQTVDLS